VDYIVERRNILIFEKTNFKCRLSESSQVFSNMILQKLDKKVQSDILDHISFKMPEC